jgi:hypothetical protein
MLITQKARNGFPLLGGFGVGKPRFLWISRTSMILSQGAQDLPSRRVRINAKKTKEKKV